MPSAAFLTAAKRGSRRPVILMAVESHGTLRGTLTTRPHWEAGVNTRLDTTTQVGDLMLIPAIYPNMVSIVAPYDLIVTRVTGWLHVLNYYAGLQPIIITSIGLSLRDGTGAVRASATTPAPPPGHTVPIEFIFPPTAFASGETIDIAALTPNFAGITTEWVAAPVIHCVPTSGHTDTIAIDLGEAPGADCQLLLDDDVPIGAGNSIVVTVEGSADGGAWASLGVKTHGDALTAYRHYRFKIDFTSANGANPVLREIVVRGGNALYRYYSTHRDEPVAGARPYIKKLSPLSSRIEMLKPATTGEATVTLQWTEEVSDLLATGYLKNKGVAIKMGFVGLAEADYEPIFTGFWHDYSADAQKMEISVKLRDVQKKFAKRSLPLETFDANGNRSTSARTFTNVNLMQAILDVLDAMGLPDNFIDRAEFEAIRDGARAGAQWNVTRTLGGTTVGGEHREPVVAEDLLTELATIGGLFLVPMPDGRYTPIIYDPAAAAVATFDALFVEFGPVAGNQKELFTRALVYHSPLVTNPGESAEDYGKGFLQIDADAETNYDEVAQKVWYDKWGASYGDAAKAVELLADRIVDWFAIPRFTVSAKCPPHFAGVLPGQIVAVDNLRLPCAVADWPGLTHGRKFLVTSRRLDPQTGRLDFDLYDTGLGDLGADTWQNPVVVSGNAAPLWHQVYTYTAAGGTAPYTWAASAGVLVASGASATLDVTDVTGDVTISATDSAGATGLLRLAPVEAEADDGFTATDIANDWEPDTVVSGAPVVWTGTGWADSVELPSTGYVAIKPSSVFWGKRPKHIKVFWTGTIADLWIFTSDISGNPLEGSILFSGGSAASGDVLTIDWALMDASTPGTLVHMLGAVNGSPGWVITAVEISDEEEP